MKLLLLLLLGVNSYGAGAKKPTPKPTDEQYVVPNLSAKKQERKEWCAASAGQMLLTHFKINVEQCEIASRFHRQSCCNNRSVLCSKPMHIEGIARLFNKMPMVDHNPTLDKVWNLVKSGTPVSIYHHQYGTPDENRIPTDSPHVVVAYWVFKSGGKKYVIVYDPFTGTKKTWDSSYVRGNLAWYRLVWMK